MTDFSPTRYEQIPYRRCGTSGLKLPALSLGGWHNFTDEDQVRSFMRRAFDLGVTHFDFANNYGPPPGRAEEMAGKVLKTDFSAHRDELIISTKAGYDMWPGPYGEWGSRKYLIASLDQSLRRLGLDYVDIFYSHRPDPVTPLQETMGALHSAVQWGKALYPGISNYSGAQTDAAAKLLESFGTPLLIHQPRYSMLAREVEQDLLPVLERHQVGAIAFSPLGQGLLTDRYLGGIPADSRAAGPSVFLSREAVTPELLDRLRALRAIAGEREQSLAEMAVSWILRLPQMTSVLCGISRLGQLEQNVAAASAPPFSSGHLERIEAILQP